MVAHAGGNPVREHRRRAERGRRQPRPRALPARDPRRGRLVGAAAPPSRASSARNGSGRNSTTPSIRARCARRPSSGGIRHHRVPPPRSRSHAAPRLCQQPHRPRRRAANGRAAMSMLASAANTRAYAIGGEMVVLQEGARRPRSTVHAGRSARAWRRARNRVPRPDGRCRPLRHRARSGLDRAAQGAQTIFTSPICARSRCRASSRPITCRRSPKPRRCSAGTRATASVPIAARRRRWCRPAGGATARPARPSIFRAPIRS